MEIFFFSFITLLKRVSVLGPVSVSKKLPFAVSRPCRVKKFYTECVKKKLV